MEEKKEIKETKKKSIVKGVIRFLRDVIGSVFGVCFMFYLGPILVILTVNFLQLVVFGDTPMSEFQESWDSHSVERLTIFYKNIFEWFGGFVERLKS